MDEARMDEVQEQYEAYPYPARDPADEAKRLIVGSPSHPVELDHFLFEGKRDWSAPFRALVAGGGAGDALVMLAQLLADRGTPAELHYLDLSRASRAVAEARIARRGLSRLVTFHTADLAAAADLGPFDYIDCCGVLHHLPDPDAGFSALARALAPDGGLGAMVYAPYGRSGVYELQAALRPLVEGLAPAQKVALAKKVLATLPPTHTFARNPLLVDHKAGDAGLYDLLLHARDRAYDVGSLLGALERAGLRLAGFVAPARYDPTTYLPRGEARARAAALPEAERYAMAERLAGNVKKHVFYAVRAERGASLATPRRAQATPVPLGLGAWQQRPDAAKAQAFGQEIARSGRARVTLDGFTIDRPIAPTSAAIVARLDGVTTLEAVARASGFDWLAFSARFAEIDAALTGINALAYSDFWRR